MVAVSTVCLCTMCICNNRTSLRKCTYQNLLRKQALKERNVRGALAERLKSVSLEDVKQFPTAAIEEVSTLDRAQVLAIQV